MKISVRSFNILCAIQALLFIGGLFAGINAFSESTPFDYLKIEELCKPGYGLSLGEVQIVRGKVIIIREEISHSCWAKRDISIFNKDIISTQENGRMRFSFNDGSLVTLASRTELEITRSIYDQAVKERYLVFNMRSGKARFLVKKLDGFKHSEAKVKTKTALVVVKGSDFIIEATDKYTRITSLADTQLEVLSLDWPDAPPALLSEFNRTVIEEGILPSEVETVPKEEIELMLKELMFVEQEKATETQGDKKIQKGVLVPKDKLIEPEGLVESEKPEKPEFPEPDKDLLDLRDRTFDEKLDDGIRTYVPQIPKPPYDGYNDDI